MRVSYWTGWLDPEMVAVSKEVHQLMRHFPGSCAFGLSSHYTIHASWARRSLGVHPRFYPVVRPLVGLVERRFDVSHVYTSLGDWHFLNALGRRPIVLTVTQRGEPSDPRLLQKVAHVAAETDRLAAAAQRSGVESHRISVVYPGVDFGRFALTSPPDGSWRCVFASSPETPEEVRTKGVDLLLAAAALTPDVEYTLLWRPFGPLADAALDAVRRQAPANVVVVKERVADMAAFLARFHFAVAPFRTVGKPCPNSIMEVLALGRPALVSEFVDIGDLLEREGAGLAFAPEAGSLAQAIRRVCESYASFQGRARACAERHFDLRETTGAYERIYRSVTAAAVPQPA